MPGNEHGAGRRTLRLCLAHDVETDSARRRFLFNTRVPGVRRVLGSPPREREPGLTRVSARCGDQSRTAPQKRAWQVPETLLSASMRGSRMAGKDSCSSSHLSQLAALLYFRPSPSVPSSWWEVTPCVQAASAGLKLSWRLFITTTITENNRTPLICGQNSQRE